MIKVKVKKLHPDAKLPTKGSPGAACWDVYALEDDLASAREIRAIRTGIAFELPRGYEIEIRPRSSFSQHIEIVNSPGTLDSDYRGELLILVVSKGFSRNGNWNINKGDRIAQIKVNEVLPVDFVESEELSETERGSKGFGSTGK